MIECLYSCDVFVAQTLCQHTRSIHKMYALPIGLCVRVLLFHYVFRFGLPLAFERACDFSFCCRFFVTRDAQMRLSLSLPAPDFRFAKKGL